MKYIPFTQFVRPDGRQRAEYISLEDDCAEKYIEIAAAGCRLTCEFLMNGQCSFCIEEPILGDYACAMSENGPNVPTVISKMIRDFKIDEFNEWKSERRGRLYEDCF